MILNTNKIRSMVRGVVPRVDVGGLNTGKQEPAEPYRGLGL